MTLHRLRTLLCALALAPFLATAAPAAPTLSPTLTLSVDATDLDHRVLQVRESLQVEPGPLRLLFPRWLPGTHGPYGPIDRLAGLTVRAGERPIEWRRDPADPFAFVVDVPAGTSRLDLAFQHIAPLSHDAGRVSITPAILGVQWETVLLYPAGRAAHEIVVQASLKLPAGWQAATALRPAGSDATAYAPVTLETLVDSPVFAARHLRRIALDAPGHTQPVTLNLVADEAKQLEAKPAQIEAHRALVRQADLLFGTRPYRHYDFLLALSDSFGGMGLEHMESSENAVRPIYFSSDWAESMRNRDLLAHEYVHTWNGKLRRPADLATPDFNTVPMRNSLLWLYEGQTQFWGRVLAARSKLATPEQTRDSIASLAASYDHRSGRAWRSLQDTTYEGTMAAERGSREWPDWQRTADYYDEGTLIWLEADMLIRDKSAGKRSLDDFARAFFGVEPLRGALGEPRPRTYTFDDVVRALDAVQPHDWAGFLRDHLDNHRQRAPLDGLAKSGWRLAYGDEPNAFDKHDDGWSPDRDDDFAYSLGLAAGADGKLKRVQWNSPAFKAGLAPGAKILAVNGRDWSGERLAEAIKANQDGQAPIELIVQDGEHWRLLRIDYRGGLRYPRLERVPGTPDRLSTLLAPRVR